MARRRLTLQQSLRAIKLFYELLQINNGRAIWSFWDISQEDLTALFARYNVEDFQDSAPPYRRSLSLLQTYVVTLQSYLSSANLHTPIDEWVENDQGGNKEVERNTLIADLESEVGSIAVMRDAVRFILASTKWLLRKVAASEVVIDRYNKFTDSKTGLDNVINRIISGDISKDNALERTNNVLVKLQEAVDQFIDFYHIEPDESEFKGLQIMFGHDCVKNMLEDVDIQELIVEAGNSDPLVGLRVNEIVTDRRDIHLLDNEYIELMQTFSDIKSLVNREEDERKVVSRLRRNIECEAQIIADEIYVPTQIGSISIVTDLIKQIEHLSNKMSNLSGMTDDTIAYANVHKLLKDGRAEAIPLTDFVRKAKTKLLLRKDELFAKQREEENQQRAVVQQILKAAPSDDLMALTSRREIVPFLNNFKEIRNHFKKHQVPDWRTKLLKMGKKSMKIEADRRATRYMDSLSEFEQYIKTTHVSEVDLIEDLMSDLKEKAPPASMDESIPLIQEALIILETIKKKSLGPKFTERNLEDILKHSLTKKDKEEYRRAYAKEKIEAKLLTTSTVLEDSDSEDSDKSVDWDATIQQEITDTTLDSRRNFLTKFLQIKLVQLKDIERSRRTLGEEKKKTESKRSFRKVRFQDRVFLVASDSDEMDDHVDSETEMVESFEDMALFVGKSNRSKGRTKDDKKGEPSKYKKKTCPIKCQQEVHSNGSLYFCRAFRGKSKDERRLLARKCHVCITCLSRTKDNHRCEIGPCKNCGAAHNILLCTKEAKGSDNVLRMKDLDTSTDGTEDDVDDSGPSAPDSALVMKTSTPKGKANSSQGKADGKDAKNQGQTDGKEQDQEQLSKVREFLKQIVEVRNCSSQPTMDTSHLVTNPICERVCLVRDMDEGQTWGNEGASYRDPNDSWSSSSKSDSSTESSLSYDSSEDDTSSTIRSSDYYTDYTSVSLETSSLESSSGDVISDTDNPSSGADEDSEDLESNDGHEFNGEPEPAISPIHRVNAEALAELDEDEIPGLVSSSSSGSDEISSEEWSEDDSSVNLDTDYESKILLMTSISNLRRREELGISSSFIPSRRRRPSAKKKTPESQTNKSHPVEEPMLSLHETQAYLRQELSRDDRGIKESNPRQSMFSNKKWEETKKWGEILSEKNGTSENADSVKLIYEPTLASTIKVTQLGKGLKKLTIGPGSRSPLFNALISFATEAYAMVSKAGRNMSSMVTPITLLGDRGKVNVELAESLGIPMKDSPSGLLLEVSAIADTGADTCVSERIIRRVLGREALPDARGALQGATGLETSRDKDKLRIVCADGQITVCETRIVDNLGKSSTDTASYRTASNKEFGIISPEDEQRLNYNDTEVNTRFLIGLRTGNLLATKLEDKEIIEQGWSVPMFSPDLKIWRTPLGQAMLVSGSVGINPQFIEPRNNFPRFNVVVQENMNEMEVLRLINMRGTELINELKNNAPVEPVFLTGDEIGGQSSCFLTREAGQPGTLSFVKGSGESKETTEDYFQNSSLPEVSSLLHSEEVANMIGTAAPEDRILIFNGEILLYSTAYSESFLHNSQVNDQDRCLYTKSDSANLQKILAKEMNSVPDVKRLCVDHRAPCEACNILNKANHPQQSELMSQIWENLTTTQNEDGTLQIHHKYMYRNDPCVVYDPANSNIQEAAGHSRATVKRALANGSLSLLEEQVEKMISKQVFEELSDQDILALANRPHHFCKFNHVFNQRSVSTPYRMVSNTSSVSSTTTISVEMLAPEKVLNSQEASLVRFRLNPVGLAADVKSAYHTIKVDVLSSYLRLFFWWADLPGCTKARIFRQISQSFGDPAASVGLELAILKFIVENAELNITKFVLEFARYADNIVFSLQTVEEYFQIKQDLIKTFKQFSMNLKYVVSDISTDPDVLQDESRGSDPIEKLLGLEWSLIDDTVRVAPMYSLYGSSRGVRTGPMLTEMTEEQILNQPITRLTFLRLTAQSYNRMQDILGPLLISVKAFASRSCELATVNEMEMDLNERDSEFVKTAKTFILNLRKVGEIKPFQRAWVPPGHRLVGFATSFDGGALGYGTVTHSLAAPVEPMHGNLRRNVCAAKSRISKRNIPAHETLAAPLGGESISTILDSLKFDYADMPLIIHFLSDSTCFLSLMNPMLEIRNTLFKNAVNSFREKLLSISAHFKQARISVGYVKTDCNPADAVTKLLLDPVQTINSTLYREGPAKYESLGELKKDTVLEVCNGEFNFLGIPQRFMPTITRENTCMICEDVCGLVMTRLQKKQMDKESKDASSDVGIPISTKVPLLAKINARLMHHRIHNLIDCHTPLESTMILDKETYNRMLAKFFTLPKLLAFLGFVVAIDLTKNKVVGADIQKEAFGLLLRTSQEHYKENLKKLGDIQVHGILCMSLRLLASHTLLFDTNALPVISDTDPVKFKFIRYHHIVTSSFGGSKAIHNSKKGTVHAISKGIWGVTWHRKRYDVSTYGNSCGLCNRFRVNNKFMPFLGPSLNKVEPNLLPFFHVSIDPLGHIWTKLDVGGRVKLYPLIVLDIDSGVVVFEILKDLTAREIFFGLSRVQWRYNTEICQIYTDAGTQFNVLGNSTEFYQRKLAPYWGVYKNLPDCQFRNLCERRVRDAKKAVKMALSGKPGVVRQTPSFSYLETLLTMVSNVLNKIPFCTPDNTRLLSPIDCFSPWMTRQIIVKKLPGGRLSELHRARELLLHTQQEVLTAMIHDFANEARLAGGKRMALGVNRNCRVIPQVGDVVQATSGSNGIEYPEVGVIEELIRERDASVRLSSGRILNTSVSQLTPVAMADPRQTIVVELEENEEKKFTHFVSLELMPVGEHSQCVLGTCSGLYQCPSSTYQAMLQEVRGIGQRVPVSRMHLTVAVLKVGEKESSPESYLKILERVKKELQEVSKEFCEMGFKRFYLGIGGLKITESPCGIQCVTSPVLLGKHATAIIRSLVCERLGDLVTDDRWFPHVTMFRKSSLSYEDKQKVQLAAVDVPFGTFAVQGISFRQRKGMDPSDPLMQEPDYAISLSGDDFTPVPIPVQSPITLPGAL